MSRAAPVRLMEAAGPILVGVSSYARAGEVPAFSIPTGYIDAVRAAGAVPVVLPPGEREPARLLTPLSALIVSGGGDIDPKAYGGAPHETVYSVSEERDEFEFRLARAALARDRFPMLCICRGMQVLNVICGGTLHAHVPERFGETVAHRKPPRLTTCHPVKVAGDSRLAAILDTVAPSVCSWHHQAIDRIGNDLKAVAWAEDGLVEAIEHTAKPECVAVQWHPEMQLDDPAQVRLFHHLVANAGQRIV